MRETLFMETTRIAAERTVSEIQSVLAENGAFQVLLEFDERRKVSALSFRVMVKDKDVPFRLPCRWQNMETLLRSRDKRPKYDDTYEDWARRVA